MPFPTTTDHPSQTLSHRNAAPGTVPDETFHAMTFGGTEDTPQDTVHDRICPAHTVPGHRTTEQQWLERRDEGLQETKFVTDQHGTNAQTRPILVDVGTRTRRMCLLCVVAVGDGVVGNALRKPFCPGFPLPDPVNFGPVSVHLG
jgi:hypothetical protein